MFIEYFCKGHTTLFFFPFVQQAGSPVDVEVELTEVEFNRLTSRENSAEKEKCGCSGTQGLHIVIVSILFIPFSFISSFCVAFYFSALTWYNLFLYFLEERTILHKLLLCPVLILTFPFWTPLSALVIGLWASVVQISWYLSSWLKEIKDFEKGFYAWFCTTIALPQCSPYDVVIIDEDVFPDG